MIHPDTELKRVATGTYPEVQGYQGILLDAGIESHVVGDNLDSGIGTALTGSVELWVRDVDFDRAVVTLRLQELGKDTSEHPAYSPPESDKNHPHTYAKPDVPPHRS
jgi:hypothetical protein